MLNRVAKIALYVVPASGVLSAFAVGHLFLSPKQDRLQTYRIENGLIAAPAPEPEPVALPETDADTPPPEMTPEGQIIPPSYRYFSFMSAFTGNIGDTRRLFSLEISVSIFDTPLRTESMLLRLTDMEAQLRPYVLSVLAGVTEEELRSSDERSKIADRIRDALNAAFQELGEDISLKSAVITSFLLT